MLAESTEAGERRSFSEQDSTAVPKFAYRSFCPCGNLVGECLPQTLLMRLTPLENVVRRHTSFEELTPTLLREFVEKIVVHECSYDENKTRRQDIEIYYSFVGKVDLPE